MSKISSSDILGLLPRRLGHFWSSAAAVARRGGVGEAPDFKMTTVLVYFVGSRFFLYYYYTY
jgi:hypothetical protein